MTFDHLEDYEPDYDAMWDEYVRQDEEWVFYATHELVFPSTDVSASAPNERQPRLTMTDK